MTGMQNKDITAFKTSDEAAKYFTDYQFKLGTLIAQQVSISIVAMIEILNQVFVKMPTITAIKDKSYATLVEYADNAFIKEPL
jgi:hypothetical protein